MKTVPAGLNWNPPLVDTVEKVNVTRVRSSSWSGMMLTEDEKYRADQYVCSVDCKKSERF